MNIKSKFLKIFFPLRGTGAIRKKKKPIKPGYYWVLWSAANDTHPEFWRIALMDKFENWTVTGSARRFRASDFIDIGGPVQNFPWMKFTVWMICIALFGCLVSILFTVLNLIKYFSHAH